MNALDRRALLQLAGLAALGVPLAGCSVATADPSLAMSDLARTPAAKPVPSSLGGFQTRLFDQMPAGNVVMSPVSIAVVLAMLGNGAGGTTRSEFESVLGSPLPTLNAELNTLTQALVALDGQQGTQLAVSNALWLQSGMTWKQPFLDDLKRWYGTGGRQVDFFRDTSGAITAINGWCSEATRGLIPTIVDNDLVTRATRLVAGNAVYVKGPWKVEFDKAKTTRDPFTTGSGKQVTVDMMHDLRRVKFRETDAYTAIALPFRHEDLAFVAAVPKGSGAPTLSAVDLTGVLDEQWLSEVDISLPRFRAEFSQRLDDALRKIGLVEAWGGDFSPMTSEEALALDFVQHKAVVAVDETGAEAAAVTVGGMVGVSITIPRPFVADRPFLWAIVHVPTKSLVILGREDDPTA